MDSVPIAYIASSGLNTAEYVQQKPSEISSAGKNGSTICLAADAGKCVGGAVISNITAMNPITKVLINNMDECPSDKRRLTIEEATRIKDGLVPLMGEWDIIKLAGGKISGSGYGNKIDPGYFDDGWGWVFLVDAGFHYYDKVIINSLNEIPEGWRRATIEECRSGPQAHQIRSNLGQWDIIKVAGGSFDGPGYGSNLLPGYRDDGLGWVILVSQ